MMGRVAAAGELPGTPKEEIDTPALLIDATAFEQNIGLGRELFLASGRAYRPHTKTHKSPLIARLQLENGAAGVCCAKLGEAEVMAAAGIGDVLITTPVVGQRKISRLIAIAGRGRVSVVADDRGNVDQLSAGAASAGITLAVLVEVDVGQGRCGVPPGRAGELARRIASSAGLTFEGLQGYNGAIQLLRDFHEREVQARASTERLLEAAESVEDAGLAIGCLTGGGTGTSALDIGLGGLTEIQPGSYVFMDATYRSIEWTAAKAPPPFRPALSLLATVVSRPARDRAIVDVGWKSASVDSGPPVLRDLADARFEFAGDEHGALRFDSGGCPLEVGSKVELDPSHCDTTVNLYDRYLVVREGTVESVWEISARGRTD
jgi:D-serine deaminase-like pyridoxal phosphate-dependent protein